MARIRTIKPDAFLSESLASVPRGTRWTFAGLWTYADDKGRGRDDARLIHAALYAIDDDVTIEDVREDLARLTAIGGVCRYVVDGRDYLHMPKWDDHQRINRPTPAKSPPCPLHEDGGSGHVVEPEDSVSNHGALSEPSPWEGKGREGKGREFLSEESDETEDRFDEFWGTYGHKIDRRASEQKWRLALKKPGVTADLLIDAARQYVTWERANNAGGAYIMGPAKWLLNERWADERESKAPTNVRRLPHASELELPPDGLSPEEYAAWDRAQRAKRANR